MSDKTVCDICNSTIPNQSKSAKFKLPHRYKVYDFVGGRVGRYDHVPQDVCETCRHNLHKVLMHLERNDMSVEEWVEANE